MQVDLGGQRIGSGNKMKVNMRGFNRSTHDLSYVFRSTMSAGTLVPFMVEIGLNADTFDIDLDVDIKTHPTVGPLFGSLKFQGDVFIIPMRLYNSLLHNNALNIGRNMAQAIFPRMAILGYAWTAEQQAGDLNGLQINTSCLLAYLGFRGLGNPNGEAVVGRGVNAVGVLGYWDIYKNYYANKQETDGAVIHTPIVQVVRTLTSMTVVDFDGNSQVVNEGNFQEIEMGAASTNDMVFSGLPDESVEQIMINLKNIDTNAISRVKVTEMFNLTFIAPDTWAGLIKEEYWRFWIQGYSWLTERELNDGMPQVTLFPLENIDTMRERILAYSSKTVPFPVTSQGLTPYFYLSDTTGTKNQASMSQEGLALIPSY